jgi:hypothetical protein
LKIKISRNSRNQRVSPAITAISMLTNMIVIAEMAAYALVVQHILRIGVPSNTYDITTSLQCGRHMRNPPWVYFQRLSSLRYHSWLPWAIPTAQTQFYPGSNHMHTADPAFAFAYNETSQWAFAQSGPQLQQTPTLELENFHLYPDPTLTQTNGLHNGKASSQKASTSVQPKARLWQPPNLKFEHEAMERGRMNGWSSAPEPPHDFIEPPSPEDDDSTSTLSPSSFLPLSVTLEGCNEGACHCGDGCECDGCLVHRGHVEQPRMHVPL